MSQTPEIPEIENYRHPEKKPKRIFNSGDLDHKLMIFQVKTSFFVILNL